MIRAVVFDLDGTLVDSLADIASAVNGTLVDHGREPHDLSAYKTMVGWGLRKLLVTASADRPFAPEELESVYLDLLAAYRAKPVVQTRAYPGIESLVAHWSPRVPLGVLSNKDDGMTKTIVSTLFPGQPFRTVLGARVGKPHKPDPTSLIEILGEWGVPAADCAYLGDSGVDMETARRAGAVACGASWGFRDRAELSAAGAQWIFSDPGAFSRWLETQG